MRVDVPLNSGIWIRGRLDVASLGWESGGWAAIAAYWIKDFRVASDGAFSFYVSTHRWEEMWDNQFGPGIGVSPAVPLFVRSVAPFRLEPMVNGVAAPAVDLPVPLQRDLPHVVDVGTVTAVPLEPLVEGVITVDGRPPYGTIFATLRYLDESADGPQWRPSGVSQRRDGSGRFAFCAPDLGVKLRIVVDAEFNHLVPIDPIPVKTGQTDVRIELFSRKQR